MSSIISINASISTHFLPPPLPHRSPAAIRILNFNPSHKKSSAIKSAAAGEANPAPPSPQHLFFPILKSSACAAIFAAATTFSRFPIPSARAELPPPSQTLTATSIPEGIKQEVEEEGENPQDSPLTHLLESNPAAIDALKSLLQEKLAAGEDDESLSILRKLAAAQPDNSDWKFMIARLLSELGRIEDARDVFEEILSKNPLCFEALFENALLMDRSGEREAVMRRLQQALAAAEREAKAKEARDVKLIMAQMQFLHKDVEEALRSYDELAMEDPSDFRPYFCKGMIYSLMEKNAEAKQQFAKYRELSPKKFEVEGYLRTPLSRMKLFGTDEEK